MEIHMKVCALQDVSALQIIGKKTFYDTFKDLNSEENMNHYLQQAFNKQQLEKEIANPHSFFYLLYVNQQVAGYLKLNVLDAQTESMGNDSLEIERIYLSDDFQGLGLGKTLFEKAYHKALETKKNKIWLGVWEKNEHAIGFYKKMGFVHTGTHVFVMGDEEQTDYIMTKEI